MAQKTNFEDNLFYLNSMMKAIKDGLLLEIDPDIFLDKIIDDLFFIDGALVGMYGSVKNNSFMIKRSELLRDMHRSKKMFMEILDQIIKKEVPFSIHLESYFQKFRLSREDHSRDIRDIQKTLLADGTRSGEEEDIISETELRFLLSDEAEE